MAHSFIPSFNDSIRTEGKAGAENGRFLTVLLATALCMMSSLASGQSSDKFTLECAKHDLDLVATLDGHRSAQDISPDNLFAGFMSILRARETCYADPVAAIAMYETVIFGPTLAAMPRRSATWGVLD